MLRALAERPGGELDVIDEDGRSLGRLTGSRALASLDDGPAAEIVTARDLLGGDMAARR